MTTEVEFSFDDLLADSLQQVKERQEEKDLKKKVAQGHGRPEDNLLLKKWSREREWKRHSNVLIFTRQKCKACDSFHTTLEGRFELHLNNRLHNTTMHVAVASFELPDLPRAVVYRDSLVDTCHDCAEHDGWPLEE